MSRAAPTATGLTPQQSRFVAEYLVDLNATAAAIRAGYSARSAEMQGSRLLGTDKVRRAVDEALQRRQDRVEVRSDDILRELLRLAMVDIGEAFTPEGTLKPIHEIPADVRRAISAIEVDELFDGAGQNKVHIGQTRKVKFWDKTKGLELLGKHLKLFTDRIELSADSSFADVLKAARERSNARR